MKLCLLHSPFQIIYSLGFANRNAEKHSLLFFETKIFLNVSHWDLRYVWGDFFTDILDWGRIFEALFRFFRYLFFFLFFGNSRDSDGVAHKGRLHEYFWDTFQIFWGHFWSHIIWRGGRQGRTEEVVLKHFSYLSCIFFGTFLATQILTQWATREDWGGSRRWSAFEARRHLLL